MSRGVPGEDRDSEQWAATSARENAPQSQGRRTRGPSGPTRLQLVLRLLAPAAAALALVSVITEHTNLDHDLLLIAPTRAEPGQLVPLRALLYAGLNKPAGPALVHGATAIELRGTQAKVLARTQLRAGMGPSLEGVLAVPRDAHGKLTLVARTQVGEERVEVERALAIGTPEPPLLAPRALGPLQQLAHGPLRIRAGQPDAPVATPDTSRLALRVAGAACVPELRCELLVHVGEPAAELEVASSPSLTLDRGPRPATTSGVVRLRVITHGPEGNIELRAGDVARAVRLPIALGADVIELERVVLESPAMPWATLLGESTQGIVDVFKSDRWLSSATTRGTAQLGSALAPGLYRVQVRRDPFESESAAVRSFYVRASGERDHEVLRALADLIVARERTLAPEERDALAASIARREGDAAETWAATDFDGTSRYLLAVLDEGIARLPAPTSGYPLARKRALEHRDDVRKLALVVLVLAATSLVLMLVQRGLLASEEAASVLRASGTAHAGVRREQLRMTVRVLGSALALLLIFCAIALYLIIRGRAS